MYVVSINEKLWTRAREVCKALEYNKKTTDVVRHHCSRENYAHKWKLTGFISETKPVDWPKYSRKDDYYINEEGMYIELFFFVCVW